MLGPEVSDNNLPVNKQLHDDSSGVRGQPDQDGPGQDQGPVPPDQHSSGAAHQGYRGADQGGPEGRRIITVINNRLSIYHLFRFRIFLRKSRTKMRLKGRVQNK